MEKTTKVTIVSQDTGFTNLPNTFHNFKIGSFKLQPLLCTQNNFQWTNTLRENHH